MQVQRSRKVRLAAALSTAAVVASFAAGSAFAGEVKGPSTWMNTNYTGALDHANSICAASGLNDLDPNSGQTTKRTQTPADAYPGAPGDFCRGGSGE